MKANVLFICLSFILVFGPQAILADDLPPSEEGVCDVLAEPGVTSGLFGLCNAFCEAQDCDEYAEEDMPRHCKNLLINYERIRERADNPLDEEMPCTQPEVICPCWSMDDLVRVGTLIPSSCIWDDPTVNPTPSRNAATYSNPAGGGLVIFEANTLLSTCFYGNSVDGFIIRTEPTNAEQRTQCNLEVLALHDDFGGSLLCGTRE